MLAPKGRDAAIATAMLREAGIEAEASGSIAALITGLDRGAGFVVVTEEALATADPRALARWIDDQEEWSDLPFILLTAKGGGLERNAAAERRLQLLGNVTFLERPFHPTTLVSLARAALRGRRRQYDARRRLEALRESERQFRSLANSMPTLCWIARADGHIFWYNQRWYEYTGANAADMEGWGWRSVHDPAVLPAVMERWTGAIAAGEPFEMIFPLRSASGEYRPFLTRVHPVRDAAGTVVRWFGTNTDIAEQQRTETELRRLNETLERRVAEAIAEKKQFADVVEGTDAFVQVAGLDFRWLAINKAAADEFKRIYGVRPNVGDSMLELLADRPQHQRAMRAVWERALAGEEFTEIAEFGDPERDRRCYEMKFNTLRDPDGRRVGAYQFVYDVTDRMREQQRLAIAEEQLHQSQKMEAIGQLTGGVAHDFNNLLTPITGVLDMVRRRYGDDPRTARLADGALQAAERAKTLVQRLLGFARRQTLETRPVDLAELVQGMRELIASSIGSGLELRIVAPDGLPAALADPNQIELAVLNLAVNARDAMPEGGVVTIAVESVAIGSDDAAALPAGDYLRLSVEDTGTGMDKATLRRAIEPFYPPRASARARGWG